LLKSPAFARSIAADTSASRTNRAEDRPQARAHRQRRIEDRAADLEMRIERFARNEEAHDLARAFEDGIDAAIAHEALDRRRLVAALASDCSVS
jgi:hypothetical protein